MKWSTCRKNSLLTSIKNKEKVLVKMQDRPDPREAAPGIKAEIEALHAKMVETVRTIFYLLSRTGGCWWNI